MDKNLKYISPEQQEEFEHFLLGSMTYDQEADFKERLNENAELRVQFDEFKSLFHAVEEEGMRTTLNAFHQKFELNHSSKSSNKKRKVFLIAASITALMALGVSFFLNQPTQGEKLFEEYFSPDPGLPTVMGSNDNYDFYEAMVDYKQGHYDVAIQKWEKLLVQKPENDTLNYFLGAAYLANDNTKEGLVFLKTTLESSPQSVFNKEALYFIALGQLKNGNEKEAIECLKKISDEKSETLLKNIKE